MAVDGLAELQAQRSRRTGSRGLPAPQHRKAQPQPAPEPAEQAEAAEAEPVVDVREDPAPEPVPEPEPMPAPKPVERRAGSRAVPQPQETPAPTQRRNRVRATQVHLDQASEDHLSELRKRSVMADVDLTQSAVLRLALAELVDRHGYDRIVQMFADDEPLIRRGRPRR